MLNASAAPEVSSGGVAAVTVAPSTLMGLIVLGAEVQGASNTEGTPTPLNHGGTWVLVLRATAMTSKQKSGSSIPAVVHARGVQPTSSELEVERLAPNPERYNGD